MDLRLLRNAVRAPLRGDQGGRAMSLRDLPMDQLRALIDRQQAGLDKAKRDVAETEEVLRESLAEFHRRVQADTGTKGDDRG